MSKRVKLADYIERRREAGLVEVETDDGTVFPIDPPEIWGEEQMDAAKLGTNEAMSRALLGDRYDEFISKGGSPNLLMNLLSEEHGVSLGE